MQKQFQLKAFHGMNSLFVAYYCIPYDRLIDSTKYVRIKRVRVTPPSRILCCSWFPTELQCYTVWLQSQKVCFSELKGVFPVDFLRSTLELVLYWVMFATFEELCRQGIQKYDVRKSLIMCYTLFCGPTKRFESVSFQRAVIADSVSIGTLP